MPNTPKPRTITDSFRIELDGLPLAEAATRLTEALSGLPEVSKASARLSVETEDDYDGCVYVRLMVIFYRPETDEEQAKRVKEETNQKANEVRRLEERLALLKGTLHSLNPEYT